MVRLPRPLLQLLLQRRGPSEHFFQLLLAGTTFASGPPVHSVTQGGLGALSTSSASFPDGEGNRLWAEPVFCGFLFLSDLVLLSWLHWETL